MLPYMATFYNLYKILAYKWQARSSLVCQPHPPRYCYCAIVKGRIIPERFLCPLQKCKKTNQIAGQSVCSSRAPLLEHWQNVFLLRLSMEIGTILDLLHAAISCVCHQFNTFLTALQHLASYMYCVESLGPEDHSWQECSTSSDVMYSKEAEARLERSFNVRRGAEDLFLQCTQESPKSCRQWRHIPHIPCKHKTCWVWPDPYLHDCTKAVKHGG